VYDVFQKVLDESSIRSPIDSSSVVSDVALRTPSSRFWDRVLVRGSLRSPDPVQDFNCLHVSDWSRRPVDGGLFLSHACVGSFNRIESFARCFSLRGMLRAEASPSFPKSQTQPLVDLSYSLCFLDRSIFTPLFFVFVCVDDSSLPPYQARMYHFLICVFPSCGTSLFKCLFSDAGRCVYRGVMSFF